MDNMRRNSRGNQHPLEAGSFVDVPRLSTVVLALVVTAAVSAFAMMVIEVFGL